jgi:hypothetical protein
MLGKYGAAYIVCVDGIDSILRKINDLPLRPEEAEQIFQAAKALMNRLASHFSEKELEKMIG